MLLAQLEMDDEFVRPTKYDELSRIGKKKDGRIYDDRIGHCLPRHKGG